MKDDKLFKRFKDRIARVFNRDGLWSCESCFWLDVDDKICMLCDRISRLFIWFEELEEVFKKLKELKVEFVNGRELKEYILDQLIGQNADSSMGVLEHIVKDFRRVFGENRRIKLDIYIDPEIRDDYVALYVDCYTDKDMEIFEKIRSKYRDDLYGLAFRIHVAPNPVKKEG